MNTINIAEQIEKARHYKRIAHNINTLAVFSTTSEIEQQINYVQRMLYNVLHVRIDDKNTVRYFVYEDYDPLGRNETDQITEESEAWDFVRDIQLDIINFLGE